MTTDRSLLVLAIDAARPELIRRWAAAGKLPAIRRLLDRGTSGSVEGVKGYFIGSTWPSLYTGLGPAGHGFHRIEQLRPGSYGFHRPLEEPGGLPGTPFWRRASDAGRRVAVLDVPLSRPEPELNGIQTVEWGGHDAVFGFRTTPPGLADEILEEEGPYPLPEACDRVRRTAADFRAYLDGLEEAVERKRELTLSLLEREDWDLFVQVFTEAHCAGHQTWHLHDPDHPAHDAALAAAVGDPIERVYRAIDRAVGAIVERSGADRVLLLSAHGMRAYWGASFFLLPKLLRALGATVPPAGGNGPADGLAARAVEAARGLWRRLPDRTRDALRPLREAVGPDAPGDGEGHQIPADLTRSPCFPVPNGSPVGAVRLNLAGREPTGVLAPGAEADAFCERLAEGLLAATDDRTGGPLIEDVYRTADHHDGPRLEALPDLLVEWTRDPPVGTRAHGEGRGATIRARSPEIGTVEATNGYVRTGEHVPEGFFTLSGPDVSAARRGEPVRVVDVHPTICRLLGLPDPGVDGAPARDLLPPDGPGSPGR